MAGVTPSNVLRSPSIAVAARLGNFSYAIRNIVSEAQRVEASGDACALLECRQPAALRVSAARAHGRRRDPRDARRRERLLPVAGHCSGTGSGGGRVHTARLAGLRRSRAHHGRDVRSDRPRAERARRRGRRGARADADLPALHGGARQARRACPFLPDRCAARMGARFRPPRGRGDAGDARARRDRSQQSDRRGLSDRRTAPIDRLCRTPRPGDSCR